MSGQPARLRKFAKALDALSRRAARNPLESMRWLPSQHSFLSSDARFRLLRTGNQLGKTTAGCAEIIAWCTGRHPLGKKMRRPPVEAWIICASWSQSLAVQEKLWNLLPKHELKPGSAYDPRKGFPGAQPTVEFLNGSIIRIKTAKQNVLDLASATIDVVLCDEPPPERKYGELVKRVQAKRGSVLITMTPVNAPVDWIREAVAEGRIEDHHFRLEPQNLIFHGTDRVMRLPGGDVCDDAWIAEKVSETLPHEVDIVLHGEWETRVEGRVFKAFINDPSVEGAHVVTRLPPGDWKFALGIDHGTGLINQAGVLIAVDDSDPTQHPMVVVMDETPLMEQATTSEQDAIEIHRMLGRWRTGRGSETMQWRDLSYVYGDVPAKAGVATKGNRDLAREIARLIGKPSGRALHPRIYTAKRMEGNQRGSVATGEGWIHAQMVRGRFLVHERCEHLIECFDRYDGHPDSDFKHRIDAVRYGLYRWVWGLHRRRSRSLRNG